MRDEHRDRMLIEMATVLELLLAEVASLRSTSEEREMFDFHIDRLTDARSTFEKNYKD